jgi:hypothetical protein
MMLGEMAMLRLGAWRWVRFSLGAERGPKPPVCKSDARESGADGERKQAARCKGC